MIETFPMEMWKPSSETSKSTLLTSFIQTIKNKHGISGVDFAALYDWSVDSPELFWEECLEFCDVLYTGKHKPALVNASAMPGAKWFPEIELNFAKNLLRRRDDYTALVFHGEDQVRKTVTYQTLYNETSKLVQVLQALGIQVGDRVAAFTPNMPETTIAMLATASLGAVWSSCSPDFGHQGVLDRFGQIEPRVLFIADGYFHKGRRLDSLKKAAELADSIPSIEKVIVFPYLAESPDLSDIPFASTYEDLVNPFRPQEIEFEELPFDHPLYIMFSSGTTGKPKCIVHSAGGTLLEHKKELLLHTDLRADDRFFYQSTCGWMMWNWHMSGLSVGATLILYDGAPFHHDGKILWEIAEREEISVFGTNAKYLSAVEKAGIKPGSEFNLNSLRVILSTGSVLPEESFDFVYEHISPDVCLSSISGGTDIIGCFALGCPILPVFRGELQCRSLGLKVEVFNERGESIVDEKGELVCTAPFPSMPVSFWNDVDGERYRNAYFTRFPGIWHHGDYVTLTERGTMIFYGRSDAVLNPGGIRIGTSEIYRQVELFPEIEEAIVIGQEWEDDVRVVLFLKMKEGFELNDVIEQKIRAGIKQNASPFHVPKVILAVDEIPRTRSGKIVELAVREVVHGREIKNREALANPEALEHFKNREELRV